MSFTYVLADDTGKIRLNIGDTTEQAWSLTDEEIAIARAETTNNLLASVRCMEWLLLKLSQYIAYTAGGQNSQANQRYEQVKEAYDRLRSRTAKAGMKAGYAGGISVSRIEDTEDDSDYEKPAFSIGMDDHASTDDDDDETA